jgi:hypothetical protein
MNGNTVSITVTLPANGDDVTVTAFSGVNGMLIHEILLDNTATRPPAVPCTFTPGDVLAGVADRCDPSSFRVVSALVGGNIFRPGNLPRTIGGGEVGNMLAVRPLLTALGFGLSGAALPVPPLSSLALVMDNASGANSETAVIVMLTFAISGDFVTVFATPP